jgi:hypothetical protein
MNYRTEPFPFAIMLRAEPKMEFASASEISHGYCGRARWASLPTKIWLSSLDPEKSSSVVVQDVTLLLER